MYVNDNMHTAHKINDMLTIHNIHNVHSRHNAHTQNVYIYIYTCWYVSTYTYTYTYIYICIFGAIRRIEHIELWNPCNAAKPALSWRCARWEL